MKALAAGLGPEPEERRLLGTALPAVRRVVAELEAHPAAIAVSEAGSVRRRKETVRDVDVIATSTDAPALISAFCEAEWVAEVLARGDTKATVGAHDGLRFDLRVVPHECYGNVLQHFTGSKDHNIALREDAVRRGLSISEYGVTVVETNEVVAHSTEEELYAYLGYDLVPPELREANGEVAAARQHELPGLVEVGDLKGEMHCHSSWSTDAQNTIEEMAARARERGYSFLCLTDHSHYLRGKRLEAQWKEIEEVDAAARPRVQGAARDRGEHPLRRLARRRGRGAGRARLGRRLDPHRVRPLADRAHTRRARQPARRLHRAPDRAAAAQAAGADLDIERVVERAAETGTALEINSQPDRLDMRDTHARLAGEAGVRIPVNTDAHSVGALGHAELGVAQARRAWLSKEQILNTRTWAQISKLRK